MKRRCLRVFQAGLEATGLASLFVRLANASGATILMMHSVARPDRARWIDPRYHMTPERFELRMRFLAARRRPVSLTRLIEAMEEGRDLPPRSVVVTFDDGYLDHLTVAAPILKKYDIPAAFFIPTGYVSRVETPWVDRLHSSFLNRTRNELDVFRRFDLKGAEQKREAFAAMESALLTAPYPERTALLDSIDEQLRPKGEAPRLTLDWNDVKSLDRLSPDFEIGGHTVNHVDVSSIPPEEARREIAECAEDLRRKLGPGPRHFSFPYERWTPEFREEVRLQGFRSACGVGDGSLITASSDRFAMPRLDPLDLGSAFGFATSGAYPRLSRALLGRS